MTNAQLGNISFRLDPDQVHYAYQVDCVSIDTLGGQVVQVLGATLGDLTINGSFGQDHRNKRLSWQLAESFHASIRALMDQQSVPQKTGPAVHKPIPFTFNDGTHNFSMKVLIKAINDADGSGSIEHSNGKFSYRYSLTLFVVEDQSLLLSRISTDKFISRIASGVGWKKTYYNGSKALSFNGSDSLSSAMDFIKNNSTDGSFDGYLQALLAGKTQAGG